MRRVGSCPLGCPLASSSTCEVASARAGSWPGVPTTLLTPGGVGHCGGAAVGEGRSHRGKQRDTDPRGSWPQDVAWPVALSRGSAVIDPCLITRHVVPANEAVVTEPEEPVEARLQGRCGGTA